MYRTISLAILWTCIALVALGIDTSQVNIGVSGSLPDGSVTITRTGSNMVFSDPNAGAKTLAELAAGGEVTWSNLTGSPYDNAALQAQLAGYMFKETAAPVVDGSVALFYGTSGRYLTCPNGLFFSTYWSSLRSGYAANEAKGIYNTALGYNCFTSGTATTAIGHTVRVGGGRNLAAGYKLNVYGYDSLAAGRRIRLGGSPSWAIGQAIQTTAGQTFAVNLDTTTVTLSQASVGLLAGGKWVVTGSGGSVAPETTNTLTVHGNVYVDGNLEVSGSGGGGGGPSTDTLPDVIERGNNSSEYPVAYASYSVNAGTAGTAGYSNTAGYAETANSASSANSAGYASTANYATSAGTAGVASTISATNASSRRWWTVSASHYTSAPASSSRITMSNTGEWTVGTPMRYTSAAGVGYGIVSAISTNAYVDVAGHCLNTTQSLTLLEGGWPEQAVTIVLFDAGLYGDGASTTLLASDQHTYMTWRQAQAHLVAFHAIHRVNDGTAQPYVNLRLGGSRAYKGSGLQVGTSWGSASAVATWPTVCTVAPGSAIELECQTAGTAGNAQDLTCEAVFVLE